MADELTTPVSADDFDTAHEFVKNVLIQKDPALDLSTGSALDGLLVENEAQMAAVHNGRLTQLSESFSLAAIAANIAVVTDADVDSLVSNYFITRKGDTAASGPVQIVVDQPIPYLLPIGYAFTFNGLVFATVQAYRIYPPGSVGVFDSSDSRRMVVRADGKLEFTINVTCKTTGLAGNLAAGTIVTISNPLSGMETASVASDFTGGEARETNQQLLDRAAAGVTAKVLAGPEHIQATLANEFPGATCAVVGVGSPLMTRDRGNLFGLSTGGKQDIYCKMSAYVRKKTITVPATVLNGTTRSLTLPIPYTDGVGVYRIVAIRPAGTVGDDGDVPTSVSIGTYTGTLYVPTIIAPKDAAFSANAILTALFTDTGTQALTTGTQPLYDVDLLYMPSIEAANSFMTDDGIRPASQDILVKAAVPCATIVDATVRIPTTGVTPALSDMVNAIINAINALPIGTSSLSAYVVFKALSGLLPAGGDAINVVFRGIIYAPDGTDIHLGASSDLTVPLNSVAGVGPANTFFSCDPSQVSLTVVNR